jgi:hypothetical protein
VTSSTIKAASLFAAGQAAAAGIVSASAVALAEGALRTMLLSKLKMVTALLVAVAVLGAGVTTLARQGQASKPGEPPAQAKKEPAARAVARITQEKTEPVNKKPESEARPAVVAGIVKAVNAEKRSLTVAHQEGEATCLVAPSAHVTIDGKGGSLAAVPVGACVCLSMEADGKTAHSLSATGSSVFASVKAVDVEKSTITINGQPEEKAYRVAPSTSIWIDGKPGKLAGIPTGASLHALTLCVDQKTAHNINVEGPSYCQVCVKAVDAEKGTITFDDKGPPTDVAGKTFTMAPDAHIILDNSRGKLADLPAGAYANLLLSVDRNTIRRLHAQGPNLGGCGGAMVKAVDTEKGTITFDDKGPADVAGKTFTVASDAEVILDNSRGKFADVPAGAFVDLILSVDRSTVRRVNAQGPSIGGCGGCMVKAVDAEKGTITFDDKGPADVAGKTFTVAPDANIVIDSKRGKLAELPSGAFVNLTLSAQRTTARHVFAQGPRIGGVVKAVDAQKSTITVDDRTFSVAKDVIIGLDNKRCNLPGLPSGATVKLSLRVDRKTVAMIHARAP